MTTALENYNLNGFTDDDLHDLALAKADDLCRGSEDPQPLAEALLEVLFLLRSLHQSRKTQGE